MRKKHLVLNIYHFYLNNLFFVIILFMRMINLSKKNLSKYLIRYILLSQFLKMEIIHKQFPREIPYYT